MTSYVDKKFFRTQYDLNFTNEIIVDLFAGGGGASTGLEQGLNRPVDIAINHNPMAVSMHMVNHPHTHHYTQDVFAVDPIEACAGRLVGWLHLSPDCTHHSQAAGGQNRKKEIRDLSWVGVKWGGKKRPRIISLENVKQILQWGPLVAKRCKHTGRVIKSDGTVAAKGEHVPVQDQFLVPDKKRAGQTWKRFVASLQRLGYVVETRILKACDFDDPTSRTRLFMLARRDGHPIVWPEPTNAEKPAKGQKPWRTAGECIDWSIPSKSIFNRKKPLAAATLRRIAKGIDKFVLKAKQPYIVPMANSNWNPNAVHGLADPMPTITATPKGGSLALASPVFAPLTHQGGDRVHGPDQPLPTITAAHRGEFALASAVLVGAGGPVYAGKPTAADQPVGTLMTENHRAVATAYLAQMNGGFNEVPGRSADEPMSTVTNTGSQQQLVTAHLAHLRGNCDARDLQDPLHTVSAGGQHHALVECTLSPEVEAGALRVAAFLMEYYSEGGQHCALDKPINTITTKDRLALVTVTIKGTPYVIVDICLRMLKPKELYKANGFPDNYQFEVGHDGRRFTISQQVHMCGNSVPPGFMRAISSAMNPWLEPQRAAA